MSLLRNTDNLQMIYQNEDMQIITTKYFYFVTIIMICRFLLFYIYERNEIFYLLSNVDNIMLMLFNGHFGLKYIAGLFNWT